MREAAERLGVHENTVRNWMANGIIRSARAPGARFHRFERAEVERVRLSRGTQPKTAQSVRRIVGPELADATRLAIWADTLEARHVFPRLVRRLVASSPGVDDLTGRAGEGVAVSGWDLRATSAGATPWLPAGPLAFELGVSASPSAKAQMDFAKRTTDDPAGVVRSETVFVFVTPRRWPRGKAWAAEREAEGLWRGVRVIDGDDLEAWLEATPAVHYWISEQIGLKPHGVVSAERWWQQFSRRTRPVLPAGLFLAGRNAQRAELLAELGRPGIAIGVRAWWRDDALAFVCVAVDSDDLEAAPSSPALIVHDEEVWRRVANERGPMTLIPLFANPDLAVAADNGKRVLIPYGAESVQSGRTLTLPPPQRLAAAEALREAGVEFGEADRLAGLSRRSMAALVRRLSVTPSFAKPAWGREPASQIFAPLLLLGSWTESEEDLAVVSEIVSRPWPEIERALRVAADTDDPPFVLSGGTWRVASREEAFDVLSGSLTAADLQRWAEAVPRVLLEDDPLADLDLAEQWAARMDDANRRRSSTLRTGLADGLALLGSHGLDPLPGGITCEDLARVVVRGILDQASADQTGTHWRSLSSELALLAEGAPELFLDAILEGASGAEPPLLTMFGDDTATAGWMTSSPHTGVLWALETLCWSAEHLISGTRALAQLAAIDPGGRLANRPIASLTTVLVPWIRQTSAPLERRLEAIDQIVREFPDVAWKLLEGLWPETHGTASPPHSPRYRDWKPDERGVPISEWFAAIGHVVECALDLAGTDAGRWSQLVGRLGPLPAEHRDHMIFTLDDLAERIAEAGQDRLLLWESIMKEVERQRAFAEADWAMDEASVARLTEIAGRIEPSGNVERHARLFDWHPNIGGRLYRGSVDDAALDELRAQAVREALESGSIDGLGRLAERVPVPSHLGWAVGQTIGDDERDALLGWLTDEGNTRVVAQAWAQQRARSQGLEWVADTFGRVPDGSTRLLVALQAPPTAALWQLVDETSPELTKRYWADVDPWRIPPEDVPTATMRLLEHDRPFAAITALAANLHRPEEERASLDPQLIIGALQAALAGGNEADVRGDMLGYEIGQLLDYLEVQGISIETLAGLEFGFFQALEHHREPRALYAALGDAPELFVDLVSRVYRAKDAPRETPDQQAAAIASHAWHVLHDWRTVPGLQPDNSIDAAHLDSWVQKARLLLSDSDRADVGDEQIGELLSGSPNGADGAWPAEPVRDLVERLGSRELENGLHIGKVNARGVTSRGVYDGGTQERALAAEFRDWAATTAARWPRTSRLLRELAESYEREALREDMRAQADADAN